ncbi:hypothetical protein F511_02730 [Dorcoceras hygrometricum]|uniref:Uncharacterized protein n=1 Tax=Dorcoceras hygrometricum TaxID=472368 RepID=A0A2Z7A8A8_9LAMI|nr:hypothetical protein F511_02730 [Dorcoceras hygrometricum]
MGNTDPNKTKAGNKYEVKPQYEELSNSYACNMLTINAMKWMWLSKEIGQLGQCINRQIISSRLNTTVYQPGNHRSVIIGARQPITAWCVCLAFGVTVDYVWNSNVFYEVDVDFKTLSIPDFSTHRDYDVLPFAVISGFDDCVIAGAFLLLKPAGVFLVNTSSSCDWLLLLVTGFACDWLLLLATGYCCLRLVLLATDSFPLKYFTADLYPSSSFLSPAGRPYPTTGCS